MDGGETVSITESDFPKSYLGDGVTASFDGYHIWLRTPRGGETHEVALEFEVLAAFEKYLRDLRETLKRSRA